MVAVEIVYPPEEEKEKEEGEDEEEEVRTVPAVEWEGLPSHS